MLRKYQVTLIVEVDEFVAHPNKWGWHDLLQLAPSEKVEVVDVLNLTSVAKA
jgi:hypothetical protein